MQLFIDSVYSVYSVIRWLDRSHSTEMHSMYVLYAGRKLYTLYTLLRCYAVTLYDYDSRKGRRVLTLI